MSSVVHKMPPFKHEFSCCCLEVEEVEKPFRGIMKAWKDPRFSLIPLSKLYLGILFPIGKLLFIFSREFITKSKHLQHLLDEFPFLKIDKAIPFAVDSEEALPMLNVFQNIYQELQNEKKDSFQLIEAQVLLLLNYVNDVLICKSIQKKFQKLFENRYNAALKIPNTYRNPTRSDAPLGKGKTHSPSYYANQLGIHPNHLNTIVKSITLHTAKQHIHEHLLRLAKSRLPANRYEC